MKKITLFLTLLTFLILPLLGNRTLVKAVTPSVTPPATTPTTSLDRAQEIKDRVEERLQEVKDKANRKGFWGTLKQVSNTTLIVDTANGERRVKTSDDTKISLDKKDSNFADLGIGNFLIVNATTDKSENYSAKRISAFSKPPQPGVKRQAVIGKVTSFKADQKLLTITHLKKSLSYDVKVNDKTVITKKVDGKIKKVPFDTITLGDRVVAIAYKEKETSTVFTAKIIHVIPGKAIGQEEPKTTPKPTKAQATSTPKKPSPTTSE